MNQNYHESQTNQAHFQELIRRAYELGTTDKEITVGNLLEEIMRDLRTLVSK
ncbi:hypothetical protein HHO41_07620 [Bacillus sp. DNRA2]|uniref:hypothetical protein n=1 Tax=Bacillus sp. DNRA2 TaxID=2723053 RepID=UPI00145F1672|nr:hypothetical protein [Bacillus sp. DNRA2]NMD70156.1 hypothetical protein [Bacillus sp. DNRA2]